MLTLYKQEEHPMKKILSLILNCVLLLGLCACAGGNEGSSSKKEGLQIGFARVDATPDHPVNLSGGDSKNRISTGYRDPITVTCIAMGTGEDTFLIYTLDYITTQGGSYIANAESAISAATGIPGDRIIMNCTHNHSGPAIGYDYDSIPAYREQFNDAAVKAAKEAIADMASAEVSSGTCDTEGTAFVRHYEMGNGTFAGSNYGSFSGAIKGHAYEGDDHVQVVRFARSAGGKKDIILISNPSHATAVNATDPTLLSGDIAYSTRDYVEKNTGCHVAYFIGAAGDQIPTSRIASEKLPDDYLAYGERLGKQVVALLSDLSPNTAGPIVLKTQSFTGNTIKEGLDRLADAQKVIPVIRQYGNSAVQTKAAVSQYGFSSPYQVSAIIARSTRADTQTMTLNAMSIGDLALIFAPYEMFSENGKFIKEHSPYGMTFVISCSEGHQGYLPSVNGFRVGCYETHVTTYERGTAETLADTYIDMLNTLKNG